FFYGINTFIRVKGLSRLLRGVPLVMLAVWLVLTLMNRDEFFLVADIFARYFIAIPGILLTASAFILHLPEIRRR
ncbi:MAG: hypothetical protein GWN61_04290, partial [candidate division Zixibacteria bacterium]|nr:hypothetical protein [candidate division Zixibacteria bacterium]NIR63286.1 hypothetical protein [candidate division Zixibacteria bacterium]NIS45268.1 hypothetical protein [candidate division Zixibacteria bacterium]NIU13408.1 hypothetical protein [candidate division Zixibacteria bacterium]NIV05418.1 hypothetical protein [candidate division Zixibacteria bacterium]